MNKTRIAIIVPGGIGTGDNNMGVPVLERVIKLLGSGHSITVFSLFKVNADYTCEGFELVSIQSKNFLIKSFRLFVEFSKRHRINNYTVLHGFWTLPSGFLALLLGKIFRIKNIVSVLGGDAASVPEINYGELRRPLSRKIVLWTLNNASEVIVLTQYLVDNLQRYGFKRAVKIIPWGIDTRLFEYRVKALSNPIQLLHIGNLSPVKDQETLLRAFKIISDNVPSHLTIIGTGILEKKVQLIIHSLGMQNKVTCMKPLPYEKLPSHYYNADILLHTSLSEGQSEVVTEAMCAGVVVCGTSAGLIYDLPECCVAVPVKDHEALALETLKLIDDPSRMTALRQRAYCWAKTHSIFWTVEKIKECYED